MAAIIISQCRANVFLDLSIKKNPRFSMRFEEDHDSDGVHSAVLLLEMILSEQRCVCCAAEEWSLLTDAVGLFFFFLPFLYNKKQKTLELLKKQFFKLSKYV